MIQNNGKKIMKKEGNHKKKQEIKKFYKIIKYPIKHLMNPLFINKLKKNNLNIDAFLQFYKFHFLFNQIQNILNSQLQLNYKEQTHKDLLLKQQVKQEFLNKLKDYLPSISPEKQQELEQIISKAHHKINFYEFIEMTKKVKLKGVFFDKEGKILERNVDEEYYEKIKENERNEEQNAKAIGNKYLNDIRKITKKPSQHESVDKLQSQSNPEQGYQQAVRNPKQNKLNEIKSHWKLKPKLTFEETDLEKIIEGNEVDGFSNHHVMQEANKLAFEAVRKIQIIEAKGQGKECFKDMESADKLLINSIKAKLTLMEKELKSENRRIEIPTNHKRGRSNTKQHS